MSINNKTGQLLREYPPIFPQVLPFCSIEGYIDVRYNLRSSYSFFDWFIFKGAAIHMAYYGIVVVLSISLMLLVPKEKKLVFFNKLGVNSLFIYLIHTNIVRLYREIAPEQLSGHKGLVILSALLFASAVCWLLTRKFILNLFKPVILPRLNWVIKRNEIHS